MLAPIALCAIGALVFGLALVVPQFKSMLEPSLPSSTASAHEQSAQVKAPSVANSAVVSAPALNPASAPVPPQTTAQQPVAAAPTHQLNAPVLTLRQATIREAHSPAQGSAAANMRRVLDEQAARAALRADIARYNADRDSHRVAPIATTPDTQNSAPLPHIFDIYRN